MVEAIHKRMGHSYIGAQTRRKRLLVYSCHSSFFSESVDSLKYEYYGYFAMYHAFAN